jgi:hypothetical protein
MMQTVVEGIEDILRQKREGTYTESDAAVLITRDEGTGILTFSFHGIDNDEGWNLFWEAVKSARQHGTHPEPV